jgi:hypothetical protein
MASFLTQKREDAKKQNADGGWKTATAASGAIVNLQFLLLLCAFAPLR